MSRLSLEQGYGNAYFVLANYWEGVKGFAASGRKKQYIGEREYAVNRGDFSQHLQAAGATTEQAEAVLKFLQKFHENIWTVRQQNKSRPEAQKQRPLSRQAFLDYDFADPEFPPEYTRADVEAGLRIFDQLVGGARVVEPRG